MTPQQIISADHFPVSMTGPESESLFNPEVLTG